MSSFTRSACLSSSRIPRLVRDRTWRYMPGGAGRRGGHGSAPSPTAHRTRDGIRRPQAARGECRTRRRAHARSFSDSASFSLRRRSDRSCRCRTRAARSESPLLRVSQATRGVSCGGTPRSTRRRHSPARERRPGGGRGGGDAPAGALLLLQLPAVAGQLGELAVLLLAGDAALGRHEGPESGPQPRCGGASGATHRSSSYLARCAPRNAESSSYSIPGDGGASATWVGAFIAHHHSTTALRTRLAPQKGVARGEFGEEMLWF